MKNAKERKTEIVTEVEQIDAREIMEEEAIENVEEALNDIPVDIIEESEGNYASM
jgi:hypothetical protein